MSEVVVTRSSRVVVEPASGGLETAATGGVIGLSSFDKLLLPIPATLLLVFDQPMGDPVGAIKKALSQALVHYSPVAGRLVAAADGVLHIACTGEGVSFVGASANCALDQATLSSPLLLKDLAVSYPGELCRLSDPLLLMQVTQFSCGGFVVGVTWNHILADAAGMAQFLQAVGELARGMPAPSVVPVRFQGSLPCLPAATSTALTSQMGFETEEMAYLDVTVPSSLISRIKAEHEERGCTCTAFEVVAAVLWRCRTRALVDMAGGSVQTDDEPALLAFTNNVRKLVGAKRGYYGNCAIVQLVQSKIATVATSNLQDLIKLIQLTKEKAPDHLFVKDGGGVAGGQDMEPQQQQPPAAPYNTLTMSSLRNLGFEGTDYGGGRMARVMWHAEKIMALPCVVCPPCKGKAGVNVLSLCLKPAHAGAFLREFAALTMLPSAM